MPRATRPMPVGKPVPTADHVAPSSERSTLPPCCAANQVVVPAARATTTLVNTPVRRRSHVKAAPDATRSYRPVVVAATQWLPFAGSTAIWKNAKPASDGLLVSLCHV